MGALTRIGLAALVVAAAAVAAVLLLGRSESPPALAATAPLVVHAGFDPPTVTFGDRVVARVVVLLDRAAVRPATLKLTADIAPLTQLAAPRTTRTTRGSVSIVTYEVPAACVTDGCIASAGDLPLRLPRVIAAAATRSGGAARADGEVARAPRSRTRERRRRRRCAAAVAWRRHATGGDVPDRALDARGAARRAGGAARPQR